jgi:hypothetical protein
LRDQKPTFINMLDLDAGEKMLTSAGLGSIALQIGYTVDFVRLTPDCEQLNLINLDAPGVLRVFAEAGHRACTRSVTDMRPRRSTIRAKESITCRRMRWL